MKAPAENFRGINYVRISSLPKEQGIDIRSNINSSLIIKILKEGTILNDCLQYEHYLAWYESIYLAKAVKETASANVEFPVTKWAIAS